MMGRMMASLENDHIYSDQIHCRPAMNWFNNFLNDCCGRIEQLARIASPFEAG
jgi:hypothetical protein